MKIFSSNRRKFVAAALVVLVLFLLRPGASRLKSRIIYSISYAVGRPVDIGSVHVRFLPRPGFDLENLVVYDDPAFGAEPILRAGEVTAALRLMSLVRGRLEIAQLDLTDPSLNLVQGENGRWNLEALLERTARTPTAPTAKPKSEPRPAFPYIEASSARINFKHGQEKKPYALTNADFSLWQDSENSWGVRLKAQPFRTDRNLNDTGMLQVNGTWQRAANLHDTPMQLTMQWSRAQLGQITKFFTGNDQGWRGAAQVNVTLSGTPASLRILSDATVDDFRRFDIASGEPLHFAAHCDAQYSSADHMFRELTCTAPVAQGLIALRGRLGLPGSHNYDLAFTVVDLPASFAVALIKRAKKNLPDDLAAHGTLRGSFVMANSPDASHSRFEGQGELADFQLASASNKAQIGTETIPISLTDSSAGSQRKRVLRNSASVPDGPGVEIGPFPVAIGRVTAPTVRGWVNRGGYSASVTGEADIAKALRMARMVGLPALQSSADGVAQLDLQIAGSWAGWMSSPVPAISAARVTGSAKLRNVLVAIRGVDSPIEIPSADLQLTADEVRVTKLTARAADSTWTGSLALPRGCGTPDACEIHFDLNAPQISLSTLNAWANPAPGERPWYRLLGPSAQSAPSFLANLRGAGRVTADRLLLKNASATHLSANVSVDRGKLRITALRADLLGGKHAGEWHADFTAKPAMCDGSGSLTAITLAQIETAEDQRLAGTANAAYELKGECPQFWTSAEGKVSFDLRNGIVPRLSLGDDEEPLKLLRLSGEAHLHAGKFEVKDVNLDSASGKFLLTGSASLSRDLDLKLSRPANKSLGGYAITGTVSAPQVEPLAGSEQARLKTEPPK